MRITIYGAGAVGGHLAVRLASLPELTLSVVARGAHLAAIRQNGLVLKSGGQQYRARPNAVEDPAELPPQDLVFVTLKAHSLPGQARSIAGLLAADSKAVFLPNGIPWWMVNPEPGAAPSLVDPESRLREHVGIERSLGGTVYSANIVEAPGIVRHVSYDHWLFGEPGGGRSDRVEAIVALLKRAGLNAEVADDLQVEIWKKLVLNASANPLSALTGSLPNEIAADPGMARIALALRREIDAIAQAQGHKLGVEAWLSSLDQTGNAPPVRPSMLQDVLDRRPMEVEAMVGQASMLAHQEGVAVPTLDTILALLRALDRSIAGDRL